jgi:hypothetical protein
VGVERLNLVVNPCLRENGKTIWRDPVNLSYSGAKQEKASKYQFEGSLLGLSSSVSIDIEAREFKLHVLGEDEPVRFA